MSRYLWLSLLFFHSVLSQTTDKYSDEDRPYKFGFNIQGYQHRQEEKDERGLIKGEYGFITADGYYRVTVYATDENGDFRIISMKNYYVGFPPEDPTTTPGPPSQRTSNVRQPVSNPSFSSQPGPTGRALSGDAKPVKSTPRPQGLPACSDCSIPTTTTRTNQGNLIEDVGDFRSGRKETGAFGNDRTFGQGPTGGQSPQITPKANFQGPAGGQNSQFPQGPSRSGIQGAGPERGQGPQFSQGSPSPGIGQSPQSPITASRGSFGGFEGGRGSTPFGGDNGQSQGRPGSTPGGGAFTSGDSGFPRGRDGFIQNNQLDEGPRQRPRIGEVRDGLPPGVTVHDIKDLLYTFNYTVGFHGHHEDGYRNGDKEGDYFFDGRDGVERKVEYIANEFGYQPNITLIDLPENDVRRPNEQTEKEYGLKGYEFKWFYRK